MDIYLVYFGEDGARRDFHVRGGNCLIGRKPECDLQIPLATVSREHCRVWVEDDKLIVRDLGSSNGTFRNDERVDKHTELEPGDRLSVGAVVLTVRIDGVPEHVEPPLLDAPTMATPAPHKPAPSTAPAPVPAPKTQAVKATKPPAPPAPSPGDSADIADLISGAGDESSVFDFDFGDSKD